ncbi:MAG: hypothetical protein ACU843_18435 [Gammaproteobacteria bacterium]
MIASEAGGTRKNCLQLAYVLGAMTRYNSPANTVDAASLLLADVSEIRRTIEQIIIAEHGIAARSTAKVLDGARAFLQVFVS